MKFIDCHCHVNFAAFKDDWKETISRAHEAGIFLVNVGTQKDTSRRAVEIANEYESGVYAAVGVHPIHTDKSHHDADELGGSPSTGSGFTSRGEEFDYECYKKLAMGPKVVAIGECGLDYYRTQDLGHRTQDKRLRTKEVQKKVFEEHVRLSHEVGKPLMIHCREAYEDLCEILISNFPACADPPDRSGRERAGASAGRQFPISNPGIVHFFSGTKEDARKLLDLGFSFTFGGVITFTRDYDEVIRFIPVNRILSETDAPYVSPVPYRKERNEPLYVIEVVKKLAEIRGISEEEIKEQIWENAKRVFRI